MQFPPGTEQLAAVDNVTGKVEIFFGPQWIGKPQTTASGLIQQKASNVRLLLRALPTLLSERPCACSPTWFRRRAVSPRNLLVFS